MHVNDEEALKKWIITKLERNGSDADADVLADYVLALAKTQQPQSASRDNYVENLRDFLSNNTEQFVDELLLAISTRSFDPSRPALRPTASEYQPSSFDQQRFARESRKRSYHDRDGEETANGQIQSYHGGERPMKHPRRGGRGNDNRRGRQSFPPTYHDGRSQQPHMPPMPTPPPGMPPFDPNNPMAALLAMQQAMGLFPGVPNGTSQSSRDGHRPAPSAQRCRDYDTMGFCAAGASCPYEHGEHPFVMPSLNQEYDPNNAALLGVTPTRVGHFDTARSPRGKGRHGGRGRRGNDFRGVGKRSNFSQVGPNQDTAITTIVVESIPKENCDEQSIRDFFSQFGKIDQILVDPESTLAIVKFDTYQAARAAYDSKKAIFDNRFVKVFWQKPERVPNDSAHSRHHRKAKAHIEDVEMDDNAAIDMEEITKRQEEAQRKHEQAREQREQAEKQRAELDIKLKAMDAERKKIAGMIAKKSGKAASPTSDSPQQNEAEDSEQTKALKAQLAKLEAEAKSLGIDPEVAANGANGFPSYRGRGSLRGRGRGRASYPSYRGGWVGRGGAVMRLDNRPKTVAITFAEGSFDDHDEALRQFLLFNSLNFASLEKHPDRDDTALVTFQQRYEGENFMQAAARSEILHIGKVELAWYKPDGKIVNGATQHGSDAVETDNDPQKASADLPEAQEYDMADEEDLDRWT